MILTDFLLARIAEDEEVARAARDDDLTNAHMLGLAEGSALSPGDRVMAHPARVLAECEAKRRIVARQPRLSAPDDVRDVWWDLMALLALPYADHPDYDERWRP